MGALDVASVYLPGYFLYLIFVSLSRLHCLLISTWLDLLFIMDQFSGLLLNASLLSCKNPEFAKLFVPLTTALCAFLIMSATNPFLGKLDNLWVIFLPIALINAHLTQRSKLKHD